MPDLLLHVQLLTLKPTRRVGRASDVILLLQHHTKVELHDLHVSRTKGFGAAERA